MNQLHPETSVTNNHVLASLLEDKSVPMDTLHERYGALLELVRILIGVIPKCDSYLEIWPPAFRTYNLMVPNFLNLPFGIFGIGGAPKDIVGLGMYAASRSAECPYCSAHTCSFAMRRGMQPGKLTDAFAGDQSLSDAENTVVEVATALAQVPASITQAQREQLDSHFNAANTEWIVLGISMMGFLNKFMDAIGVDLEPSTYAEVKNTMGVDWTAGKAGRFLDYTKATTDAPPPDSISTKLSVIRYAPAALKLDKQWQEGVPNTWPAAGEYLKQHTGHDFPVLSRLQHKRAIRSTTAILKENLSTDQTVIGLKTKTMAGVIFATIVKNDALIEQVCLLAKNHNASDHEIQSTIDFANNQNPELIGLEPDTKSLMALARAISATPAEVTGSVIDDCRSNAIAAEAIVELVTWISVLQMLQRLTSYYSAD